MDKKKKIGQHPSTRTLGNVASGIWSELPKLYEPCMMQQQDVFGTSHTTADHPKISWPLKPQDEEGDNK